MTLIFSNCSRVSRWHCVTTRFWKNTHWLNYHFQQQMYPYQYHTFRREQYNSSEFTENLEMNLFFSLHYEPLTDNRYVLATMSQHIFHPILVLEGHMVLQFTNHNKGQLSKRDSSVHVDLWTYEQRHWNSHFNISKHLYMYM